MIGTIFQQCVASVQRRGFHTERPPLHFHNAPLMEQFNRLVEEVGEWSESGGNVDELADVVIVCAQVAYLMGVELSEAVFDIPHSTGTNLVEMLGTLARGLRRNDSTMYALALSCLVGDCVLLARENGEADLRARIVAKLAADEQRGYLHGREPSICWN